MGNQTIDIIRRAVGGKPDKYNILTFPTHERYESQLCKTGHNFYSFSAEGQKTWDNSYAPRPDNYYILPQNAIYQGIRYDFILSQSKFGQFQVASQINNMLQVPLVSLEHTVPIPHWPPEQADTMKAMKGDKNIFISEYSMNAWDIGDVPTQIIHHGVDSGLFSPSKVEKKPHILSVANDFVNRDYCLNFKGWQRITQGLDVRLVGATEGWSEPAPSTEALVVEYNSAQIFLNTSTLSPIPTSLLEAMSCGCAVVSTSTCMIPEIIKHRKNGMISNNEDNLRRYITELLENEDMRRDLGEAARATVLEKFSEETFVNNWNVLFDEVMQ